MKGVGEKREMRLGGGGADPVDLMDNWKDICLFSGENGEVLEDFERGGP